MAYVPVTKRKLSADGIDSSAKRVLLEAGLKFDSAIALKSAVHEMSGDLGSAVAKLLKSRGAAEGVLFAGEQIVYDMWRDARSVDEAEKQGTVKTWLDAMRHLMRHGATIKRDAYETFTVALNRGGFTAGNLYDHPDFEGVFFNERDVPKKFTFEA
jgi:hypothetical protein